MPLSLEASFILGNGINNIMDYLYHYLLLECIDVILMLLLGEGQIMLCQVDTCGASSSPLLPKFIFYTFFLNSTVYLHHILLINFDYNLELSWEEI